MSTIFDQLVLGRFRPYLNRVVYIRSCDQNKFSVVGRLSIVYTMEGPQLLVRSLDPTSRPGNESCISFDPREVAEIKLDDMLHHQHANNVEIE